MTEGGVVEGMMKVKVGDDTSVGYETSQQFAFFVEGDPVE